MTSLQFVVGLRYLSLQQLNRNDLNDVCHKLVVQADGLVSPAAAVLGGIGGLAQWLRCLYGATENAGVENAIR